MAARSVDVTLENKTAAILVLKNANLSHGIWTTRPPTTINPMTSAKWRSESDGFMTGTEGTASFEYVDSAAGGSKLGDISMHWDDPFTGDNEYNISVDPPNYQAQRSGGSGDNAQVTFTVSPS